MTGVFALILLLVIASLGSGVGPVKATPQNPGTACRNPVDDIPIGHGYSVPKSAADVNATVTRVNASTVRITYRDLGSDVRDFGPSIPTWLYEFGVRVRSAEGFRIHRSANSASMVWNSSVATPSVTVTTVDRRSPGGFDEAGASIQSLWGFLPILDHSHPTNISLASGQPGFVGDQVLLLGNYTVYRRSVGCHDIELYLPNALNTSESPTAIADSLRAAARNLNVGWRYETVRVFGVGRPIREGGRAFTHEVWVNVNSPFEPSRPKGLAYPPRLIPSNVWIHEYVHTRERWVSNSSVSIEASWLTEGIASYYMISETERQGRMQAYDEMLYWQRLNESLLGGPQRMNLTNRSTYQDVQGDYTRGAYVLAALDNEIRTRTGGRRSLEDVFYRLNQQEEVNQSSFRHAVVEVSGEDMGPWVDRYVAGTAVPPAPGIPLEVYRERLPYQQDLQIAAAMLLAIVLVIVATLVLELRKRIG